MLKKKKSNGQNLTNYFINPTPLSLINGIKGCILLPLPCLPALNPSQCIVLRNEWSGKTYCFGDTIPWKIYDGPRTVLLQ